MHKQYLLLALDQAWLGRGRCAPNPSVGAVAVHEGRIIAQTWHRGAGTPHAEQLLLEQLPKNITGITLYVTLEPCNHWGKTPPCVDAIIQFGIKKVVYAYRDPNPVVIANNTPRRLNEQGIDVFHYPLPEINAFYQSYHYWIVNQKPWVTVKLAQTMDGKIAGIGGKSVPISNETCRVFTHKQRQHSDILLTTAKTVNEDDPLLNVRLNEEEIAKPVAIIDTRLALNPKAKVFQSAKHCHIYYDEQYQNPPIYPNSSCHPISATKGLLNLETIILNLGQKGYHDIWVEAGGTLFNALHLARLVNKTYIYLSPKVLGERALSVYHHPDIFHQTHQVTWNHMGDNVMATYDWVTSSSTMLRDPCSQG